jgi:hypothetical protein
MQRCMQKMLLNRATPADAVSLARSLHHAQRLQNTLAAARQVPSGASVWEAVPKFMWQLISYFVQVIYRLCCSGLFHF